MGAPDPEDNSSRRWWLRRADQAAVAVLVAASLAVIGGRLAWERARRGGMIEIDQAQPRPIAFEVDLNRAEWAELSLLPGVGETLARRIVESREAEGPFLDHSDLQRVRGIGPKTVERVSPYLRPLPPADTIVEGGDERWTRPVP